MDRYLQPRPEPGSYHPQGARYQDVYAPFPMRVPMSNSVYFNNQASIMQDHRHFMHPTTDVVENIHEIATPDIPSLYSRNHYMNQNLYSTNTREGFQDEKFNLGFDNGSRHTSGVDVVQKKYLWNDENAQANNPATAITSNRVEDNIRQGFSRSIIGNVHTQPEAAGHVSGCGGSTPEAVQTSNGSTSIRPQTASASGKREASPLSNFSMKRANVEDILSVKDVSSAKYSKQKDLHSSGIRIFTGSAEKVIKWHKSLQEIGVNVVFEVIGRCIAVRSGRRCEKLLLLRDPSGPVLQATYFEIDFLLPDLHPGSTLRVIGKMVGSNRMVAYKVREAQSAEVSSLQRLGAISHHMVTKLLNYK